MNLITLLAITGLAFANDGDTLTMNGQKVRLSHIDAPELTQTCARTYCGEISARALAGLLASNDTIVCEYSKLDYYRRVLAECRINTLPVNLYMVQKGLAEVYRGGNPKRIPPQYWAAEKKAKKAKRGIWAMPGYISPKEWRKKR